ERARLVRVERAAGAGVDVRGAEAVAEEALEEEALLVGRLAADDRRGLAAGAGEAGDRRLERLRPRDRAERAALVEERLRDPLLRVDRLVAEAAAVAEPAVVDVLVVTREHAEHARVVADRELDVALARAHRADRAGLL